MNEILARINTLAFNCERRHTKISEIRSESLQDRLDAAYLEDADPVHHISVEDYEAACRTLHSITEY
jgi:hypothetical protein